MVGHIGHGGSAIVGVGFYLRMAGEGFAISFLGGAESRQIGDGRLLAIGGINHNRFDVFRSHYRPQAAARRNARGQAVFIVVLNACGGQPHLAAGADQGNGRLCTKFLGQLCGGFKNAQAKQVGGIFKADACLRKVNRPPTFALGLVFENQGVDSELGKLQPRSPSGIGFFYAAGKRAFAANRDAIQ